MDPSTDRLYRWSQAYNLQKSAMEDLLKLLTSDTFSYTNLPTSDYLLKKMLENCYPGLRIHQYKDPITEQSVPFLNFMEIYQMLWTNEELRQSFIYDYNDDGVIDHPSKCEGW